MNSKPSSLQKQQPKFRLGRAGEQLATQFLIQKKYSILDRNVRWKQLEVDIIALDPNGELVFVEVKTRTSGVVAGHLAVGYSKLKALGRFANLYVKMNKIKQGYRIDAMCIVGNTVNHYRNLSWFQ